MGKQAFDYYYGDESNQFSFYRIPRQLITGEQFRNIRAYLLTALYNAPATINNYYQAEVQHDFGP